MTKANYFKLGLFVIGAVIAGIVVILVIGSGRWLQPRFTIETYFNESVQGLDIGSKVKYRGVVIGEVTRITFTYVRYELDKPISERMRYVLVEAQVQPRLVGGRAVGDITRPENASLEVERGLRIRLAPQGITGTNYLEMDYVEPIPPPLPIDWVPENTYIPSAPSTVTQFVTAASEIIDRLHRLDVEGTIQNLNRLLVSLNDRVNDINTKGLTERAARVLDRADATIAGLQTRKLSEEATALVTELRATNNELRQTLANPAWQKLPEDASAAIARVRDIVDDPNLPRTLSSMSRTLGRLDRILGGGEADLTTTIQNLRQITDNLRDLTEEAKRYPAGVLFGQPPRPTEPAR
ncbi:MAG TPA: MlaD family protein [Casimicrobiaceae bacterium]|nr:MlaD family protein [Casimicrobiaceae bacterium]